MNMLRPDETELRGESTLVGTRLIADAVTERIQALIASHLHKVAVSDDGWSTLYQDPTDGRYWEHYYLHGEVQGGGSPALRNISELEAEERFYL